jgi:hypothetical protein
MNAAQRLLVYGGICTAALMGMFPPWLYTTDYSFGERSEKSSRSAGYAFLGKPPEPVSGLFTSRLSEPYQKLGAGVRIDVERLAVQYVVLAILSAGLFFMFKGTAITDSEPQATTYTDEEIMAAVRKAKASIGRTGSQDRSGDMAEAEDG